MIIAATIGKRCIYVFHFESGSRGKMLVLQGLFHHYVA